MVSGTSIAGNSFGLQNPLFATYVVAATIMILKAASMSWLTVARMLGENRGFRSPGDVKKTPFNPDPDPKQLLPNAAVERIRRIHLNDLENIPFFLVAGFLFVLTDPSLVLARVFFTATRHPCAALDLMAGRTLFAALAR